MNIFRKIKAYAEYLFALGAFKLMGVLPYRSFASLGRIFGGLLYFIPGFGSLCRHQHPCGVPRKK